MLDTCLIFVEGIMGSGKSTTAEFIAARVECAGIPARFMREGPTREEPQHPLRVATALPHPQGVWLDVTVEEYIALSLWKWQAFVREAERSRTVTVCDGLLFHGNMTDLMLMDAGTSVLRDYVEQVLACTRSLQPSVVYLHQADVARALRMIRDARGAWWETYQVNWKIGSPYAVRRGRQGFDGLIQIYRDYRVLCDGIFAELALPKISIETRAGNWHMYEREILDFLGVPTVETV